MAELTAPTSPPQPPQVRRLSWDLPSDTMHVASIRRAVEQFCAECGFDATACGEVGLVVNEAMANVICHAYNGASDGRIHVEVQYAGEELRVMLRDWGSGEMPPAEPTPPDPLTPGGLGLICLRAMMDDVRFTPQPDGMLLTMTRTRSRPAAAPCVVPGAENGGDGPQE